MCRRHYPIGGDRPSRTPPLDHMRVPSVDQSPVASPLKREFSTKTPEWCGAILGEAGQDLFCLRPHLTDHNRHAGLNDPTFFKGNGLFRRSQILLMVHADRRNRTGQRLLDHIGCIKPSPNPTSRTATSTADSAKCRKARAVVISKTSDADHPSAPHAIARGAPRPAPRNHRTVDANPFPKVDKVRGRIELRHADRHSEGPPPPSKPWTLCRSCPRYGGPEATTADDPLDPVTDASSPDPA